ncbi:T9SS type A sorting domain-containing protein [Hymenobacter chitinivorans]|uniref:Putative secreted protein (Por secretion system target) n=1 Tax=Hymenobacter chitinivorans DSM 11115 TaxID=1121954 RepID=A0A2M9BMT7_9BACT|nr:T9SS type A sorting domain-containing protein [Hymenobacter chitinivorans]PJJ59267.1 putative secreted protein (Por secretion system target) [Hymenobacter chitinivorans DSM 11115]
MRFKRLLILLLSGTCWLSARAQSPWEAVPSAPNYFTDIPAGNVTDFKSPQPNVVWGMFTKAPVRGFYSSTVMRTTDNGQTWEQQQVAGGTFTTPASGTFAGNLFALNDQRAWLITRDAVSGTRTLLRTTAGPANFSVVAAALPAAFDRVYFFTPTTGVAFVATAPGSSWQIYRTTDGGSTWTMVANTPQAVLGGSAGSNEALLSTYTLLGNSLWLSTSGNSILRTTDAGLTWSSTPSGISLTGLSFRDGLHGLAFGNVAGSGYDPVPGTERLLRTSDGGTSWTPVVTQGPVRSRVLTAIPGSAGVYVSWGSYSIDSNYRLVGANLSISRDEGSTWQSIIADENLRYSQLAASEDGKLWLATEFDYSPGRSTYNQYMIMRYKGPAVLKSVSAQKVLALSLYPNPTTGVVQLAAPAVGGEQLTVYDLAGRVQQTQQLQKGQQQLDLSDRAAGVYQILLTTRQGQRYTEKLLVTAQ